MTTLKEAHGALWKAACTAVSVFLAMPALSAMPVAKGFAEWTCLDAKHHVSGRVLYPGDMRGRVAVVIVANAANLKKALLDYGMLQMLTDTRAIVKMANNTGKSKVSDWHDYWPKGEVVVLFSVDKGSGNNPVQEFLTMSNLDPRDLERVRRDISVYNGATFPGAPFIDGGQPYVYVLAPGASKPLLVEKCDRKTTFANVKAAVAEGIELLKPRKPYFGEVVTPKFYPQLARSLETGKPAFKLVLNQIQKGVMSSNDEQSREAQLLLDAFDQRRSDLEFMINKSVWGYPHIAYAYSIELTQRWPSAKKDVETAMMKIKSASRLEKRVDKMGNLYLFIRKCSDPTFVPKNAVDAKKMVDELKAAKVFMEKMKSSKVVCLQDAALYLRDTIDRLIEELPKRVQ